MHIEGKSRALKNQLKQEACKEGDKKPWFNKVWKINILHTRYHTLWHSKSCHLESKS